MQMSKIGSFSTIHKYCFRFIFIQKLYKGFANVLSATALIIRIQKKFSILCSLPLQMCCDHGVCQRSAGSARGKGGGAWRDGEGCGLSVRGDE